MKQAAFGEDGVSKREQQRMPSLDALRALAAGSVLLVHWCGWISGKVRDAAGLQAFCDRVIEVMLKLYANEGQEFVGVILFIVLSGFCIHWPNAGTDGAPPSWKSFSLRRFWRLYPVFAAATFVGIAVLQHARSIESAHVLAVLGYMPSEVWHVAAKLSGISHWLPGESYQRTFLGNAPLATVVTEAWLYALYPLVFLLRRRAGWAWVFLAAMGLYALCPWLAATFAGPAVVYRSVFCYLIFWVAGAWAAEAVKRERWPSGRVLFGLAFGGLLLQGVLSCTLPAPSVRLPAMLIQAFSFAALLAAVAKGDRLDRKWPGRDLLAWLGERSYSVYAFHAPVIALGLALALHGRETLSPYAAVGLPVLAVLVGLVFYALIESPSHRLARRLASREK